MHHNACKTIKNTISLNNVNVYRHIKHKIWLINPGVRKYERESTKRLTTRSGLRIGEMRKCINKLLNCINLQTVQAELKKTP